MNIYELYLMSYNPQKVIIKNFEKGIIYDGNIESIPLYLVSRKIFWLSAIADKLIIDVEG